jgi:hypothetical protein
VNEGRVSLLLDRGFMGMVDGNSAVVAGSGCAAGHGEALELEPGD